ncbi:alpha/beta fold hydrolase [Planctomycetota bacterium]
MVTRALYPFESRYLDLDGLRYHYLDEGSGDPIVALHGNPTWSFYYRSLIVRLRGSFRVIAPDHMGCGLSDKPQDDRYDYSLKRRARDLEVLLDDLGVDRNITLVLHDWGGMIGMAYASSCPARIARIVLLNTAAFHLPKTKPFPWALRLSRSGLLGAPLIRGLNLFCRAALRTCVKRKQLSPEERSAYLEPYSSWRDRVAVLRFVQDIPLRPGDRGYDLISEVAAGLSRFRDVPMLICWGLKDFVFDHHFLAEWVERFPEAEVHTFEEAGHYILEDATDEVLTHLESFLARHPVQS